MAEWEVHVENRYYVCDSWVSRYDVIYRLVDPDKIWELEKIITENFGEKLISDIYVGGVTCGTVFLPRLELFELSIYHAEIKDDEISGVFRVYLTDRETEEQFDPELFSVPKLDMEAYSVAYELLGRILEDPLDLRFLRTYSDALKVECDDEVCYSGGKLLGVPVIARKSRFLDYLMIVVSFLNREEGISRNLVVLANTETDEILLNYNFRTKKLLFPILLWVYTLADWNFKAGGSHVGGDYLTFLL